MARTAESSSEPQPPVQLLRPLSPAPTLHVFNTITNTKVPFHTVSGTNLVRWYCCGPTVNEAPHFGHARNYVTLDIIRRILQDYFNYDVQFVMNVTDIDDKVFSRGRQAHLLSEYAKKHPVVNEKLLEELEDI